jgi:hypothetical protein
MGENGPYKYLGRINSGPWHFGQSGNRREVRPDALPENDAGSSGGAESERQLRTPPAHRMFVMYRVDWGTSTDSIDEACVGRGRPQRITSQDALSQAGRHNLSIVRVTSKSFNRTNSKLSQYGLGLQRISIGVPDHARGHRPCTGTVVRAKA